MRKKLLIACMTTVCILSFGCSQSEQMQTPKGELRDNTPVVLEPSADRELFFESETITLDASHTSDGYIMVQYHGTNEKTKFQILAPNDVDYTYAISNIDSFHVFPLPGGTGTYQVRLLESVSADTNKYAIVFNQDLEVSIADEFEPFLRTNHYVNFSSESISVAKAKTLASDCYSDLDVINNVYHYVTQEIKYDTVKAQNLQSGYTPDPDETLRTGTGICFDYASLMSAMLRSQQIPTRLEVGYAGDVYHAWISCYVDEIGWVDNIISFDGEHWSLLDPTLAANNSSSDVQEFIGDGSNYLIKYTY